MRIDIQLSSYILDLKRDPIRIPPRPLELRGKDFEVNYDFTTLFADCFWDSTSTKVIVIGPPLLNLQKELGLRFFALPGEQECEHSISYGMRFNQMVLRPPLATTGIMVKSAVGEHYLTPQPNNSSLFAGKRTILTLSKNNELVWIEDWARFHQHHHGCDAFLFYDNNSDVYEKNDIVTAIKKGAPKAFVTVVSWPLPYGVFDGRVSPGYEIWESVFCQSMALEHARQRFLSRAKSVLNVDIDELVLPVKGGSVFELTENSSTGFVQFSGLWVEGLPAQGSNSYSLSRPLRHLEFYQIRKDRLDICERKWSLCPDKCPQDCQWEVHGVQGMIPEIFSEPVSMRHFKGINTNWDVVDRPGVGHVRTDYSEIVAGDIKIDCKLKSALDSAFGSKTSFDSHPTEKRNPVADAYMLRLESQKFLERGCFDQAETAMKNALKILPDHPGFMMYLADIYQKAGHAIEAESLISATEKILDGSSFYHLQRGRWAERLGRFEEAKDHFKAAVKLSPKNEIATFNLFKTLQHLGLKADMDILSRRWGKITPQEEWALRLAAMMYSANNNYLKAIKFMEQVIRLAPDSSDCFHQIADYCLKTQQYDLAEEYVTQALNFVQRDPQNREHIKRHECLGDLVIFWPIRKVESLRLYAMILKQTKRLNEAESVIKKALILDPNDVENWAFLLELQKERGHKPDHHIISKIETLATMIARRSVDTAMGEYNQNRVRLNQYVHMVNLLQIIDSRDKAYELAHEASLSWPTNPNVKALLKALSDCSSI